MKKETRVNHTNSTPLRADNPPLATPIYRASKFALPDLDARTTMMEERDSYYVYSRVNNPTVRELERLLADIQGQEDALCLGSGVATITGTLLHLLASGDSLIVCLEGYKPTRVFARDFLRKFGITTHLCAIGDHSHIEQVMKKHKPRCIIFESPTNPSCQIADIGAICALAKQYEVLTILDNTFAGVHAHTQFPIDIYVHSLSKFVGGHSDVIAGAILSSTERIRAMKGDLLNIGATMDPETAYLCLRGMKTYYLRYRQQSQHALQLAEWLSDHPALSSLSYPGLPDHPGHALAASQLEDFGAVIYATLRGGASALETFIRELKLISFTGSLGSTETVVAPGLLFYGDDLSVEEQEKAGLFPGSFRLSIGIEHLDDLRADLQQALDATLTN